MQTELENLKLALTSPRRSTHNTLKGYLSIANHYLMWLEDRLPPSEEYLHRYFAARREEGIGESSLRKVFTVLKKLYQANGWDWPLGPEDRPEAPLGKGTPAFPPAEIAKLIRNSDRYSRGERFYLALATVYAPHRAEMARLKNRDIQGSTIQVKTIPKGEKRIHLIPGEILPVIEPYRPRENNANTLSHLFKRICEKGFGNERHGYGWDSFRRTLEALLPAALIKADKPLLLADLFLRWSKPISVAGLDAWPEISGGDLFALEREVFEVHPFLPLWADQA